MVMKAQGAKDSISKRLELFYATLCLQEASLIYRYSSQGDINLSYRKRFWLCALCFVLIICSGCGEEETKTEIFKEEVVSIRLECVQSCLELQYKPFTVKTIEDEDEVKRFVQALNQAEERLGMLDYSAMFMMRVTYDDGTIHQYHLNIREGEIERGLLVDLNGLSTAYELPEDAYAELAGLIYDTEE